MAVHGDEVVLLCEPNVTTSAGVTPKHQRTFLRLELACLVVTCLLLVVPFLFFGREFLVSMICKHVEALFIEIYIVPESVCM